MQAKKTGSQGKHAVVQPFSDRSQVNYLFLILSCGHRRSRFPHFLQTVPARKYASLDSKGKTDNWLLTNKKRLYSTKPQSQTYVCDCLIHNFILTARNYRATGSAQAIEMSTTGVSEQHTCFWFSPERCVCCGWLRQFVF